MMINLYPKNDQDSWQELITDFKNELNVETFMVVPQNEIFALNIAVKTFSTNSRKVLVYTSEINNLANRFRFVMDNYDCDFYQRDFFDLSLDELKNRVLKIEPEIIIFDLISFDKLPDFSELYNISRLIDSKLILCFNSGLTDLTNLPIDHADLITGELDNGVIISKNDFEDALSDPLFELCGGNYNLAPLSFDLKTANNNASLLYDGMKQLHPTGLLGSSFHLPFKEKMERVEDFKLILQQIGINVHLENKEFSGKKSFLISSIELTKVGFTKDQIYSLGNLIEKAFSLQNNLLILEELREEVLNIHRV